MADMERNQIGGVKELVVLVGILLTVVAGAIGTYWVQSQGVEAASTTAPAGKATEDAKGPRVAIPAPPAGVFHADVYFDFKSTRLRADAARVLQETTSRMDLTNAWSCWSRAIPIARGRQSTTVASPSAGPRW